MENKYEKFLEICKEHKAPYKIMISIDQKYWENAMWWAAEQNKTHLFKDLYAYLFNKSSWDNLIITLGDYIFENNKSKEIKKIIVNHILNYCDKKNYIYIDKIINDIILKENKELINDFLNSDIPNIKEIFLEKAINNQKNSANFYSYLLSYNPQHLYSSLNYEKQMEKKLSIRNIYLLEKESFKVILDFYSEKLNDLQVKNIVRDIINHNKYELFKVCIENENILSIMKNHLENEWENDRYSEIEIVNQWMLLFPLAPNHETINILLLLKEKGMFNLIDNIKTCQSFIRNGEVESAFKLLDTVGFPNPTERNQTDYGFFLNNVYFDLERKGLYKEIEKFIEYDFIKNISMNKVISLLKDKNLVLLEKYFNSLEQINENELVNELYFQKLFNLEMTERLFKKYVTNVDESLKKIRKKVFNKNDQIWLDKIILEIELKNDKDNLISKKLKI